MAFGFKQLQQGPGVFVRNERRFVVSGVRTDPAGMDADDVDIRLILKIVMHGHGGHIQGGLFHTVVNVEGAVAFADASGF